MNQPTAAITGAGSGLGRSLALELARRGYAVYGTANEASQIDALAAESKGAVRLLICDITDVGQVADFASAVGGSLDLLISNAGVLTPGPLETVPLAAMRREFEVNTLAVCTVVNAFAPALRKARGRIVQVSTMSVDRPRHFNGLSAASKVAAEMLMTIYRQEFAPFGIDVVIAVPGHMRTGGPARTAAAIDGVRRAFTPEQAGLYLQAFDNFAARINASQAEGTPSDIAAREIADLAERRPAPQREPVGDDARALLTPPID